MSTVLQVGNLFFELGPANEEAAAITSGDKLGLLEDLMGTGAGDVDMVLMMRTVFRGRGGRGGGGGGRRFRRLQPLPRRVSSFI